MRGVLSEGTLGQYHSHSTLGLSEGTLGQYPRTVPEYPRTVPSDGTPRTVKIYKSFFFHPRTARDLSEHGKMAFADRFVPRTLIKKKTVRLGEGSQ